MRKKVILLFILSIIVLVISGCNISYNVRLYLIKDTKYFVEPVCYKDIQKDKGSIIDSLDCKTLLQVIYSDLDIDKEITNYHLYQDKNLKFKLDLNYKINEDQTIYVYINPLDYTKNSLGEKIPSNGFYFVGEDISDYIDLSMFTENIILFPNNSLSIDSFYKTLPSKTISFDDLYDFYLHYRSYFSKTHEEILMGFDILNKDKISFKFNDVNSDFISFPYTFANNTKIIYVYYDNKLLPTLFG